MQLDPSVAATGVRLIARDAVASTNAEALALARVGESGMLWLTGRLQTAGRGRRGRQWHSPSGNLYASLLLTAPCLPEQAPQFSFVAALALHDALTELALALGARLTLKWPNDLLLDGGKVAGILVEGETLADGRFAAVIGIGVNCASHPADTSYPATDLAEAGIEAAPEAVFECLSRAMSRRLAQWDGGKNFAAIRNDWLAHTACLGEPILLRAPADIEGVFAGVDEHGRLLLRTADGAIQTFAAAEVDLRAKNGSGVPGKPARALA